MYSQLAIDSWLIGKPCKLSVLVNLFSITFDCNMFKVVIQDVHGDNEGKGRMTSFRYSAILLCNTVELHCCGHPWDS